MGGVCKARPKFSNSSVETARRKNKLTGFPSAMTSARSGGRARALAKVGSTESLFEEQSRNRRACSSATQSMELKSLSAFF